MKYESDQDVKLRLQGSLVRMGGRPVIVDGVYSKNEVNITDTVNGERQRVNIKLLDLTPVPLGFVIDNGSVTFVTRKPTRKFKQGLTQENIYSRGVLGSREERLMFTSKAVGKTVMGDYPSVADAFQVVRKGELKVCPFAREWAVADYQDELCVVYRREVVGFVGDVSISLLPERSYLKESLELCLNSNM